MQKWQCRVSNSLGGGFAGTPEEVWGTLPYETDDRPTVFFGLYGLPDFYTLWRHKANKAILWCGSDIRHFMDGYWLDEVGEIRINPEALAEWINKNVDSYVENEVEQDALERVGIYSTVVPSFLGNIDDYPLHFSAPQPVKLYTSVSGNDFDLYGWSLLPDLAERFPDVEFHCFGNTKTPQYLQDIPNIIVHGRVSQTTMNRKIRTMTGALRLTQFDGFSEILAKSILWGQYPVSLIPYPHMLRVDEIDQLNGYWHKNTEGREYYKERLNLYPWNSKK